MNDVLLEIDGGVAVLTLNRPAARNAFTGDMGRRLGDLYGELDADDAVRAVVLTGTPPAFCAGADLNCGGRDVRLPDDSGFSASPVDPARSRSANR